MMSTAPFVCIVVTLPYTMSTAPFVCALVLKLLFWVPCGLQRNAFVGFWWHSACFELIGVEFAPLGTDYVSMHSIKILSKPVAPPRMMSSVRVRWEHVQTIASSFASFRCARARCQKKLRLVEAFRTRLPKPRGLNPNQLRIRPLGVPSWGRQGKPKILTSKTQSLRSLSPHEPGNNCFPTCFWAKVGNNFRGLELLCPPFLKPLKSSLRLLGLAGSTLKSCAVYYELTSSTLTPLNSKPQTLHPGGCQTHHPK